MKEFWVKIKEMPRWSQRPLLVQWASWREQKRNRIYNSHASRRLMASSQLGFRIREVVPSSAWLPAAGWPSWMATSSRQHAPSLLAWPLRSCTQWASVRMHRTKAVGSLVRPGGHAPHLEVLGCFSNESWIWPLTIYMREGNSQGLRNPRWKCKTGQGPRTVLSVEPEGGGSGPCWRNGDSKCSGFFQAVHERS